MAYAKTKKFDVVLFSTGSREQAERQFSILNDQVWGMACNWGAKQYNLTVQDVEDQMQWTLNKIWNKRHIFTSAPNLTGFMYKVLGWRCLLFISRRRGHLSTVEALLDEESYYSNSYEHKNFTKAAIEHISLRHPLWGKIMYLYYVEDLDGTEINRLMGIPVASVHYIRRKCIQLLREWYENDEKSEYILPPPGLWGKMASAVYEKKIRVPKPAVTPRVKMRPFAEAREFARSLGLTSQKEWTDWCAAGKPKDIPVCPNVTYPDEFVDIADWLGYSYLSFEEVVTFIREKIIPLGITTLYHFGQHYDRLANSGVIPPTIPKKIDQYYKNKGFISSGHLFGTNKFVRRDPELIIPYHLARKYVQEQLVPLGIDTVEKYRTNGELIPSFLPVHPIEFYGKKWKGPHDFFGVSKGVRGNQVVWPYEKARQWVIKNLANSKWEINTSSRWMGYIAGKYPKAPKLPGNIPRDPRYYKKNGAQWVDWNHWFGTTADQKEQEIAEGERDVATIIYEMRNKKLMPFQKIAEELGIPEKKTVKLYTEYIPKEEQIQGYILTPLIPKEEQDEIVRLNKEEGIGKGRLARMYNVSEGFVQRVLEGKAVTELRTFNTYSKEVS